jgi:hypothetical protein
MFFALQRLVRRNWCFIVARPSRPRAPLWLGRLGHGLHSGLAVSATIEIYGRDARTTFQADFNLLVAEH